MESYEEFARRARIMTEVHAISSIDREGKSGGVEAIDGTSSAALGDSSRPLTQEDLLKKKEKDAKKKSLKRL